MMHDPARIVSTGGALMISLLVFGCLAQDGETVSGEARRPDVILLTIDTLRADHLSCYGYTRPTSPRIDELAADGIRFEQAVSASAYTGPSVASILTGRYPRFHSFGYSNVRARLRGDEVTLADRFLDAGYTTAAFVCNPVLSSRAGFSQGFELYDAEMNEMEAVRDAEERTGPVVADAVTSWLDDRKTNEPIFLWVHFQDPHGPYLPPEGFRNQFHSDDPGVRIADPIDDDHSGKGRVPAYQAVRSTHHLEEYVDRYDGEILAADASLGAILDKLRSQGRYDPSLILLTADHGEAFGENGYFFAHGQDVTRDQSHVPLLLKHPDLPSARSVKTPVSHIDIFPTLTAVLGPQEGMGFGSPLDLGSLLSASNHPVSKRLLFCDIGNRLGVFGDDGFVVGQLKTRKATDIVSLGPEDFHRVGLFKMKANESPIGWDSHSAALEAEALRYLTEPSADFASLTPRGHHLRMLRALGYTEE